ncbi:PBECR2 nuclease fold domain-containing protein [Romboutsia ilealis]|uniref:PBECR3 domain-containing polyvalent protein n=1 Tax=Romboutsia ilealis TaxID=1115758 RepID=UPI0026F3AF91|nr:PBECR2 nuclease fold domain-containing protein [Romboutsia ilealis]
MKYIDYIPDIIDNPDYIGINPNENGTESIEPIKRYRDNVMIGIKLDKDNDYLYVSTMHDIQEAKIQRRLHSGRIKEFKVDNAKNK